MEEKLKQFRDLLGEITDINMAIAVLGWDQQTQMPSGGSEGRGYQIATLTRMMHQRIISEEMGQLLEDLEARLVEMDPDSDDACQIRYAAREYNKRTRVPTALVAEFAQVTAVAHEAWVQARAESNFVRFQPYLERIVDLRRQYAACFTPYDHIYDPLLDDYERGMNTADVKTIFDEIRPLQVELIKAIGERPQVEDQFLFLPYAEETQWNFGVDVITRFVYDWNRGRQDRTAHPFTTNFGIDDVRITTRFDPCSVTSALFSTMHEAGHAMYEQGVDHSLNRTPLASGASLALHESQSRMWENLVGRSLPFWRFFFPRIQAAFPAQLGNINLDTFYKGINKVSPSLIRVEADEATYNLHIMLRMEIEIALMEGALQVKDLPDAWITRMKEYLGLTPPDDARGVLQDVHWSSGLIGYFSTYALGNLISVQLWEAIQHDLPDLDQQIERGEFAELLGGLREKVHRFGAKYEPQVLVKRVTGSKIDPKPYLQYLKNKYSAIYGL